MKVLLYARHVKTENAKYILELAEQASNCSFELFTTAQIHAFLREAGFSGKIGVLDTHSDLQVNPIDMLVTLGGDGTILQATTLVQNLGIPILGINLGRLGFLASIEKRFLRESFQQIIDKNFTVEERTMLFLDADPEVFGELSFALNDFTIHKRDTSSMITIHAFINGEFLNSYWADGIIVSTPTGSTGYSLSCGGPIVFPQSGNFVITPVAPHNLTVRPLVISDESEVSFSIEGRSENYLCTLDSRSKTITSDHKLTVRKCDFSTRLVKLGNMSFQKTIHEKLSWCSDTRNWKS